MTHMTERKDRPRSAFWHVRGRPKSVNAALERGTDQEDLQMSKTLMKLSAAALAICVALPASAQDEITADTVVATVNGTEITLGHMLMARASLPERFANAPSDDLWDGLVEQLIQQEALAQSDEAVETPRVEVALDNERRSLLAA